MKHFYITLLLIVSFFSAAFAQNEFIFTVQTTANNETFTIPTFSGETYAYDVDWVESGGFFIGADVNITGDYIITFNNPGIHRVEISQNSANPLTSYFPRIYFNNSGDKDKIISIQQWGSNRWTSMANAFDGCSNLEINASDTPDLSLVTDMSFMFQNTTNLEDLKDNIGNWNVGNIENMTGMFKFSGFDENINNWNVSNVRFMDSTFEEAFNFNQPLNNWVTDKLEFANAAFKRATKFNQDLSDWNMSLVQEIGQMFLGADAFDQSLGNWDISSMTNMVQLFFDADISTENYDATLIGWVTLDTGETRIPTNINLHVGASKYCKEAYSRRLLTLDPYNWTITDGGLACTEADKFITTWQTTSANESITIRTSGGGSFYDIEWGDGTTSTNQGGNSSHTYTSPGIYTVKISGAFPRLYTNNFTSIGDKMLSVEQWGTGQWSSFDRAFEGARNVVINATDIPDLSNVTNMFEAFKDCRKLVDNGGQMQNWDVSTIENFASTFQGANLFDASLENWDLSSATTLTNMLNGTNLSIANYDATLNGWASNSMTPDNLNLGAGGLTYCLGESARNTLDIDKNWGINDGGLDCPVTDFFITTWITTAVNQSITIPTIGSGYDYDIDWGDGNVEFGLTGNATHVYTSTGSHTIKILRDFPRIYFNNTGDKDKITSINQWGAQQWTSMERAFYGCSALELNVSDTPNLSLVTSTERMFMGTSNFVDNEASMNSWDTSTITNMANMFADSIFDFDISGWDVGNVTNFFRMFDSNTAFNQNISGWNIGENVTGTINMSSMFKDTQDFNQPIGSWDVSKVTSMNGMFFGSKKFNQSLANWNVSNTREFIGMFEAAEAFDQSLASWDISSATSMNDMFKSSGISTDNYDTTLIRWAILETGETQIPTGINFNAGTSAYCLGNEARNTLTSTPYNWTITDGGTTCAATDFFITTWSIASNNEEIALPIVDTGLDFTVDWGDGIITNETEGAYHTYANAGTYTIRILGNFNHMRFNGNADSRKIQTIEQWGSNKWTSMESAFKGCGSLEINATDAPDLGDTTSMESMFEDGSCVDNGGNIGNWDVSSISSMNSMFRNAYMNENINTWNVSGVKSIDYMFQACEDFNYPLDQWITTNLESAIETFADAKSFDQSLGNWDISNVSDFTDIFTNGTGISEGNYDATLIGWATLENGESITLNVNLGTGNVKYCLAESARNTLSSPPYNWTITDGGLASGCSSADFFITTWQTTTANESITIPTTGTGYNYNIDWGDGTIETGLTGNATHEYATAGIYTVKIIGDFPRFYNPGLGGYFTNAAKLQSIEQWGTQTWTSMESAFDSATNLVINATDTPDLSDVTSMLGMFFLNSSLVDNGGAIGTWDVSNVQDMGSLFRNTPFNEDISGWNTQNVTNMRDMLANCPNFDQNLDGWDISRVNNMSDMFVTSGLSQNNYDATLIGWATDSSGNANDGVDDVPSNITFNAGSSMYCLGVDAHNTITSDPYNWTITDGGINAACDFTNSFVTTWQTNASNENITIPTTGGGYNYDIDWGDGTIENGFTGNATHEYANAGIYRVKIRGDFPRIYFNNTGDKDKIQSIEQWGTIVWRSMEDAFLGCKNLRYNATDAPDLSQVTRLTRMFSDCEVFDATDLSNWNVSNIEQMGFMFSNAKEFNGIINNWDVSKVIGFVNMFGEAAKFNQDISNWVINTSEVVSMGGMFASAASFNQPINNWNVSTVINMKDMFRNANSFNRPLASWNISSITDMSGMLVNSGMSSTNYDATLMGWVRLDAGETQIPSDIILNADGITYCEAENARNTLTDVNTMNWTITDNGLGCDSPDAFISTWETTTPNESITIPTTGAGYNYLVNWGDGTVEVGISGNTTHTYANAGMYTIKITGDFPRIHFNNTGDKDKILTVEQWGTQQWDSMESAFYGCTNIKLNADDVPDLSKVTLLRNMFRDCTNMEDLKDNIGNWDVSTIESISTMFDDCVLFDEAIGGWTFSVLRLAQKAFRGATDFNQNISNWNMSTVTDMDGMFEGATSFNQPIGNWTLGDIRYMDAMFNGASAFNQDLSNWDFSNAINDISVSDMFKNTTDFNQDLSSWDISDFDFRLNDFFTGSAMSQENYDKTLIGWATLEAGETAIPTGVILNADASYCFGVNARDTLASSPYNWNITDGGFNCDFSNAFITSWDIDNTSESLEITTPGSGYDFMIDWGDGTVEKVTSSSNAEHNYGVTGTYTVKLIGAFPRFAINVNNRENLRSVDQWGSIVWGSFNSAFEGCINLKLTADDIPDLSNVTDFKDIFNRATFFEDTKDKIGTWNVSTVESFDSAFANTTLFNEDLSLWNVSSGETFTYMFSNTEAFNQNIGEWNLQSARSLVSMFFNAQVFNQPIGEWNISNVEEFDEMFMGAIQFNQPLNNWGFNTSKSYTFASMFENAVAFNQPLNLWNVSTVYSFDNMFKDASSFNQNLSDWDISGNDSGMRDMFTNSGLSSANYDAILIGWARLDAGETLIPVNLRLDVDADVTYCVGEDARNILTNAPYNWTINDGGFGCDFTDAFITTWQTTTANESITIPTTGNGYNYAVDWGDGAVERGLTANVTHEYATTGTYTVKITGIFPRIYFNNSGDKDKILSIEQWGVQRWESMESAFRGCTNLVLNATDTPDLSLATTINFIFQNTTSFVDNGGAIGNWEVGTIEFMASAFRNSAFNENINNWDVSKVRNCASMFQNATSFNQPLDQWNWFSPGLLDNMFNGALTFDQNLGAWDISNFGSFRRLLSNSGMSTENYDATLIGWATLEAGETRIPTNKRLDASSNYCLSETPRNTLTSAPYNWTINDAGIDCRDSFITTWQTTTANESISIPTRDSGYNYTVDWGDGTVEAGFTGDATHEYATAGIYTIKINGDFPRIYFDNSGDKEKILTIEQWGSIEWSSFDEAFSGCENLKLNADDIPDLSQVIELSDMFESCTNFEDLKDTIGSWDMSTIESIQGIFFECPIFNEDISGWVFMNLKRADSAFEEAFAFNQDISNWNMTTVTDMAYMFLNATSFDQPIGNWTLGTVEYMYAMFFGATAFNQDLSNWDFSQVQEIEELFAGASSFDQDLSSWDISSVTVMDDIFIGAGMSQENYDNTLIGWATLEAGETQIPANLTLDATVAHCLSVDAVNTLTSTPYDWTINDLGNSCPGDTFITTWQVNLANEEITIPVVGSGYNYNVDWGDGTIESGFTGNATHEYATAGVYTIKISGDFPRIWFGRLSNEDKGKLLTIEQWGTQQWTSMYSAFDKCTNLKLNATDVPDLSQTTNMSSMFRDCTNLEDLQDRIGDWDVSTVTRISSMFRNCAVFNEDINAWTFTQLTSSFSTFNGASAFNQNISNWNMSTVEDMESMFKDATSFNQPIGNWTLGVVDYINDFFAGATSFNQDLSNWDFSNVYEAYDMFNGATSFNQNLSAWDISNVESLDNFFIGSGMSQENYDKTLIGWATLEAGETQIPLNLTLDADVAHCLSVDAVNTLTSTSYNWTINDGGLGCIAPIITLLGDNPQIIEKGTTYEELGAEVTYGATLTIDATDININQVGTYTVTYDAVNSISGSSAAQVIRTVEVVDTTAPVITLIGDNPQVIELGDDYSELGATVDDGSQLVINDSEFMDAVGNYTIYYNATDASGNNAVEITRTVNVVDTTIPVITLTGDNPQVIELGDGYSELGAMVDDGSQLVIDDSEFMDAVGSYTIYYNAIDTSGNNAVETTRTVNVIDTIDPTVVCQNITVQLDETGNVRITSAMVDNGSTDLSGIASLAIDITDFDCTNIGDNAIVLTAIDNNGNSDSCMAIVTVEDSIDPVFDVSTLPEDIEVGFTNNDMYTLEDFTTGVVATDNCDTRRTTTISQNPAPGTLLGVGEYIITLSVEDANTNVTTATFTITVNDVLSVDENSKQSFVIYPNPTKDQFQISGLIDNAEVSIYDMNGRVLKIIKTTNNQFISVQDLPVGVYFVRMTQGAVHQTIRLTKE
ncbi:BspA family leucine-rich repeat surface protein [Aquimarina sp. MMG016]|uniref:BspA family leucine-rich repeat surface protein n=1 Tax=Aquimarina sp. MMG016 TaxID=2822690 RepID=UPI001B3A1548|nr:BspA family leucine-rich repeat surface protein [Aquimarina sp. MMG016]MBQ4821728.1 BspA family leucine-rich repeat surface protein [Aquimarina sp. MMG016]